MVAFQLLPPLALQGRGHRRFLLRVRDKPGCSRRDLGRSVLPPSGLPVCETEAKSRYPKIQTGKAAWYVSKMLKAQQASGHT